MFNAPVARTKPKDIRQATQLSFVGVTKRFGDVLANDGISFDVTSGEIHAIVGENGAGKSTLTKILYGYYGPDAGAVYLNGLQLNLRSPSHARKLGIGMVHQQLALVPSLTGFENVVLGDSRIPFAFSNRAVERQVTSRADELGFKLDFASPTSSLSVAERQKLEIFKLLWRDAQVLILDEPTSQLTPFEAEEILTIVETLANDGRIVILITHHLAEVMRFAKQITVLRKGRCVATIESKSIQGDELAKLMINVDELPAPKLSTSRRGSPLIQLKGVSAENLDSRYAIRDIDFDICAGEIVGIAGISGCGQNELGQLIAGLLRPTRGSVLVQGQATHDGTGLADLVCYIPSEQQDAVAPALSVASNCFLKDVNAMGSHQMGFIKGKIMQRRAKEVIESFSVTPPLADLPVSALSGGNLQRLIIGRELSTPARVIVADNPCAGLDAAMASMVGRKLRKAADSGRAIVLISPDLEELMTNCDRIMVMFNGRIRGEQRNNAFDSQLLAAMMGGKL